MEERHTDDWQDDYDEIKYIPPICEIVVTQGDHLQQTLSSKDDNEHYVNILKSCDHIRGLVSSFYHHRHHVEPY